MATSKLHLFGKGLTEINTKTDYLMYDQDYTFELRTDYDEEYESEKRDDPKGIANLEDDDRDIPEDEIRLYYLIQPKGIIKLYPGDYRQIKAMFNLKFNESDGKILLEAKYDSDWVPYYVYKLDIDEYDIIVEYKIGLAEDVAQLQSRKYNCWPTISLSSDDKELVGFMFLILVICIG